MSGITEYLYDENGSLVSEKEGGKTASYQYDLLNRQMYVRTLDGREQENLYDGEGLRAGLKENGKVSAFLFYNGEILAESTGDNIPVRRYIQGAGLSHVQTMDNGVYHAYHQDEQGSTAYVTDNSGTVENCYVYDAFGNMLEKKEDIRSRILYTGQQYDQETGQYYLRTRYYNPVIGRFVQEDTYRGGGLNLYAYCGNNPVMYYDPSGYNSGFGTCSLPDQAEPEKQVSAGEGSGDAIKPDFYVTPSGDAIPTNKEQFEYNLSLMDNVDGKYVGESSKGSVRVRIEDPHPLDEHFNGDFDSAHFVDHIHIEHRKNRLTGMWGKGWNNKTTIPLSWIEGDD